VWVGFGVRLEKAASPVSDYSLEFGIFDFRLVHLMQLK